MGKDTFYVTTPIYYVNDTPHIGHAYTTILADVLSRGHRLLGEPTHFLTGTDEHGMKVERAAHKHNITPIQHCDETVVHFQNLWKKLNITNDDFIRTTEKRHIDVVQKSLQDLYDKGLIYSSEYEGWYCVPCERYFTEKDLVDGCCPDCKRPVERLVEKSYFYKMSQFQQALIDHIESHPDFIMPAHRRQETLGFLRQPLGDLCISRPKSRLSWGIELPFDHDYVTYVWFDALVNYISAVGYTANEDDFKKWWPASIHLIGKDILTTHTVYWPTMLMGMGVELPKTIFAHGWWLSNNTKMSKSLGNGVNPDVVADVYGVDAMRYYLMAAMTLGQDANFSEEAFIIKFNAELANDLGNLTSRAIKMIEKNCEGKIPAEAPITDDETELFAACEKAISGMSDGINKLQLDRGISEVNNAIRVCNRYFDKMKPWTLAKEGNTEALNRVLRHTVEVLRIASGLLYPVMPGKMGELRRLLGMPEDRIEPTMSTLGKWNSLVTGSQVGSIATPLFPRIDLAQALGPDEPEQETKAPEKAAPQPAVPAEKEEQENVITIDDFAKVQLKTAEVIKAEKVEKAEKLLCLQVKVGEEERQIVAGIAKYYQPEALIGKTIIIVANLKPRELRGMVSHGMLLAAKNDQGLALLTTDGPIASGASVG